MMIFKKVLISLGILGVVGGSGTGIYYLKNQVSSEEILGKQAENLPKKEEDARLSGEESDIPTTEAQAGQLPESVTQPQPPLQQPQASVNNVVGQLTADATKVNSSIVDLSQKDSAQLDVDGSRSALSEDDALDTQLSLNPKSSSATEDLNKLTGQDTQTLGEEREGEVEDLKDEEGDTVLQEDARQDL